MKSSKQIKIEFWKRKLKEYIESIKKNSLEKTNPQMPKNWSLSKKLSDIITISVSNKQCDGDETFIFIFHCGSENKFYYSDSYNIVVSLFNKFYENFEKDNAVLQRKIEPIIRNEIAIENNKKSIKNFVDIMMLESEYEWKLIEQEIYSVLRIKLKSARIIEILIYHNTFQKHPEFFNTKELLNSIITIDCGFEKNHLPVNILNCISEKW